MATSLTAEMEPRVSRTAYDEAVGFALRQFVGRGKLYTSSAALAAVAGVPHRRIECARCRTDDPEHRTLDGDMLASVSAILGPAFSTLWMSRLMDQGAHWITADSDDRDTVPELGDAVATAARHRRDGKIDREEKAHEARVLGPKLVAIGGAMMAGEVAA